MASMILNMAIFSIFDAIKPSPFFQICEISAPVQHWAHAGKCQKVPATNLPRSTKYGNSGT